MPVHLLALIALLFASAAAWAVEQTFPLGPNGDVAHWLSTGRHVRVLGAGEGRDFRKIRQNEPARYTLQDLSAEVIGTLPDGTVPVVRVLGEEACCSDYRFYRQLSFIEGWLVADVVADREVETGGLVWLDRGGVDVHLNGTRVLTATVNQSAVQGVPLKLPLKAGRNRIVIRRTCLGERNLPFQTGLRLTATDISLAVRLPLSEEPLARALAMHRWLGDLRSDREGTLSATRPPDFPVRIIAADHILPWRPSLERSTTPWPPGGMAVRRSDLGVGILGVRVEAGAPDAGIVRTFDWPQLAPLPSGADGDLPSHRKKLLQVQDSLDWALFAGLRALRLLDDGVPATDPRVESEIDRAAAAIANRDGTSDFQMCAAIRLLHGAKDRLTARQHGVLRRHLLDGTYWTDEGNIGTMTFSSENHQVMLHGSSRLVAALYPEGTFLRSGRSATEQGETARRRLEDWFTVRERSGLHEFLAPAYTNETFLALLNLQDYDPDPALRQRAKDFLDRILQLSALHSFRGLALGPNGRCYRHELLAPQREGRSAILSWYSQEAVFAPHSICTALAHTGYQGVALGPLFKTVVERSDVLGGTRVYLHRTGDYLLGACANPSDIPQEPANPFPFVAPGQSMYQHHLWEMSLGGHARIFTQSPATQDEILDARPGYWVGEQAAPTIGVGEGRVLAIYRLPAEALVPFTHAWWPSAAFAEESLEGPWAFARNGDGYAALWCSVPLVKHGNVAQDCELRANARESAWMGIASSRTEAGTFEQFQARCRALSPAYAPGEGILTVAGRPALIYGKGLADPGMAPAR